MVDMATTTTTGAATPTPQSDMFSLDDLKVWWELFRKDEGWYRFREIEQISFFLSNLDYENFTKPSDATKLAKFFNKEILRTFKGFIDDTDPENITRRGTSLECQIEIVSHPSLPESFFNFFFHSSTMQHFNSILFSYALSSGNPHINIDHIAYLSNSFSDNNHLLSRVAAHEKLTPETSISVYNSAMKVLRKEEPAVHEIVTALCRNTRTSPEVLHQVITSSRCKDWTAERLYSLSNPNLSTETVNWGISLGETNDRFNAQEKLIVMKSSACTPAHLHKLAYDSNLDVRNSARLEMRERATT